MKTHIVALRNNETTRQNLIVAKHNNLWGMATKGKHQHIKAAELVVFMVGISVRNLEDVKLDSRYTEVFPNFSNSTLQDSGFISTFEFNVEELIVGRITSDYFEDDGIVWEPYTRKDGREVRFASRFKWDLISESRDVVLTKDNTSEFFLSDVIKALRDKGAFPSELDENLVLSLSGEPPFLEDLSEEEVFQDAIQKPKKISLPNGGIPKPPPKEGSSNKSRWGRDASMSAAALDSAEHQCEINPKHQTFISNRSQLNYVEAHHFIPLEFQDDFDFSLDVPENILALCPNCHRQFHHAIAAFKKPLIETCYAKRRELLVKRGIGLTLKDVLRLYDC